MGSFKYCGMNRPTGGQGNGECYVGRVTRTHVSRSAHLQELERLRILPGYFECNGFECRHPTIHKKYKPFFAWRKRAMTQLQD